MVAPPVEEDDRRYENWLASIDRAHAVNRNNPVPVRGKLAKKKDKKNKKDNKKQQNSTDPKSSKALVPGGNEKEQPKEVPQKRKANTANPASTAKPSLISSDLQAVLASLGNAAN